MEGGGSMTRTGLHVVLNFRASPIVVSRRSIAPYSLAYWTAQRPFIGPR